MNTADGRCADCNTSRGPSRNAGPAVFLWRHSRADPAAWDGMAWDGMACSRVSQMGVCGLLSAHAIAEAVKRTVCGAQLRQLTRACAGIVVPETAASAVVTTAYSVRSHGCSTIATRSGLRAVQVACSPHADNCDETISTLRCADAK